MLLSLGGRGGSSGRLGWRGGGQPTPRTRAIALPGLSGLGVGQGAEGLRLLL